MLTARLLKLKIWLQNKVLIKLLLYKQTVFKVSNMRYDFILPTSLKIKLVRSVLQNHVNYQTQILASLVSLKPKQ